MLLLPLATTLATTLLSASTSPAPSWVPTFLPAHRIDGPVHHMVTFDDGGGRALYAGGAFRRAGGLDTSRLASWDGSVFAPLGTGIDDRGICLATYVSRLGKPALFVGGKFKDSGSGDPFIAVWSR